MSGELANFASALVCFIAEFVGLGVLVIGFVLAQHHHAWSQTTLHQQPK